MLHGISWTVLEGKRQSVTPDGEISDKTLMMSVYCHDMMLQTDSSVKFDVFTVTNF